MVTKKNPRFDFAAWQQNVQKQFSNLDPKDPSVWPLVPRLGLYVLIIAFVVGGLWYALLSDFKTELETEQAKELTLRQDYQFKLGKAVNLEELKKQREQAQIFVAQLEKQLPGKAEMSALLSDINQAGLGRSLQFELFRPGQVVVRQYYAELPIAMRVTGNYHDIGDFTSDIAHLSRIVTLDNMSIAPRAPGKDGGVGNLTMDVTARTFRYLDTEEIAAQAALAKPAGAAK